MTLQRLHAHFFLWMNERRPWELIYVSKFSCITRSWISWAILFCSRILLFKQNNKLNILTVCLRTLCVQNVGRTTQYRRLTSTLSCYILDIPADLSLQLKWHSVRGIIAQKAFSTCRTCRLRSCTVTKHCSNVCVNH